MNGPASAIAFPDPDHACPMKPGSLLGRGDVAVPLRLPGSFTLECVLRDASRERWLGREKVLFREVNPREFRVAVEAPGGRQRLVASGRRLSETTAVVHVHLQKPRDLLCGTFRYDLGTTEGREVLHEVSTVQGIDQHGNPVMGATWRINPFRFTGGIFTNWNRRRGLAATLAWAESLARPGAESSGGFPV